MFQLFTQSGLNPQVQAVFVSASSSASLSSPKVHAGMSSLPVGAEWHTPSAGLRVRNLECRARIAVLSRDIPLSGNGALPSARSVYAFPVPRPFPCLLP
jgi:hypothetical protein